MSKEEIPADVLEFILGHIHSVEMLEVLTLLHGQPEKSWTLPEVDDVIRSNPASLGIRLRDLVRIGFVESRIQGTNPEVFQFKPVDERRMSLATSIMSLYRLRRPEIVELIYKKPLQEIMSFSDAFKVKRDKSHE